jgi:hypothetical protein
MLGTKSDLCVDLGVDVDVDLVVDFDGDGKCARQSLWREDSMT